MMARRFSLPRFAALLAVGSFVFSIPPASAAPAGELRDSALSAEKAGRWEDALQLYNRVPPEDRDDDLRGRIRLCLRHVLRAKRHRDPQTAEILSLPHFAQALKLYGEALDKLQAHHVDRDKCASARLFDEGAREFAASLNDTAFQRLYLPAGAADLAPFLAWLKEYREGTRPATAADAQRALEEVANRARRQLLLAKSNAVVLEFLCGACHSLDEYTTYVPLALLAEERAGDDEATVTGGTFPRPSVGYLKIGQFKESTALEMDEAIGQMRMQNGRLRSLVIDLRGNAGGHFETAVAVAGRFLHGGTIAGTQGNTPETQKTYTAPGGMAVVDLPLVLLIDAGTASAAEVLAAALSENRRATLVGTPTFGKGTLQSLLKFKTGSARDGDGRETPSPAGGLRITLAKLTGPDGVALAGVTPNYAERDPVRQMEAAVDLAARAGDGIAGP